MKRMLRLNLLFALLAWAYAASAQLPVPMLPMSHPATTPKATASTATAVPGLLNGFVPDETYTLRVGDMISFRVLEDRIWNPQNTPQSLVVTDSGEMDVPYIGRVRAVGKTSKELAAEIKTALEKDYYQKATVVLSLNIASPIFGRVYIWGQVRNQGPLDMAVNENLTAGKAILRAGGFADFANKRKVKLVRSATDANGKSQTFELDMQQILENGKVDQDVVLKPNDLIIVPSRLVNF